MIFNSKTNRIICYNILISLIFSFRILSQNVLTPQQWREDLYHLAEELPKHHPNPYTKHTPEQFIQAIEHLDQQIPSMQDHQIIVELARIVAMVGDGHTRLTLPQDPDIAFSQAHSNTPDPKYSSLIFSHFPIKLYWYKDGLFVQSATVENSNIIGAKVIKIGNANTDQALEAARDIIHYDNEMGFKLLAPTRLVIPEILQAIGLIEKMDNASFLLESSDGKQFAVTLRPIEPFTKVEWINANEESPNPRPIWLKDPHNYHWFEYLEDTKTVYVQYNRVSNKEEESVEAFFDRVFAYVENNPVDRFVLDLRRNSGGNNYLNLPILHGLIKSEKINQPGKLFTIIGRYTFSAAMMLAIDLEYHTNTIFVGEPTGSTPNHFGDSRKTILPNSGLTVRASTLYWQNSDPRDNRPWIAPDIAADLFFEDYRDNRDPALEAILNYAPHPPLTENMMQKLENGNIESAVKMYREFKKDPSRAYLKTENEINYLGYMLLSKKKIKEAIAVFRLNVESYPESWNVYDSLGEAYMMSGDKRLAIKNYRKSLELNPENYNAVEMLKKLNQE